MRVFIAVNFDREIKQELKQTIEELRNQSKRGNFTRIDNLHLTLAFLGEVTSNQAKSILKLMSEAAVGREPFCLTMSGFGKFLIRGESLYWYGVDENVSLSNLQLCLVHSLKENGFQVDDKPFRPHITLARRCITNTSFQEKEFAAQRKTLSMQVNSICLMKSERIEGKLIYSTLGEVPLK